MCVVFLRDHNLGSLLRSRHGDCHFLLAEELDSERSGPNRLYIAFRHGGFRLPNHTRLELC
jgi:hypothetical protein